MEGVGGHVASGLNGGLPQWQLQSANTLLIFRTWRFSLFASEIMIKLFAPHVMRGGTRASYVIYILTTIMYFHGWAHDFRLLLTFSHIFQYCSDPNKHCRNGG